MKTLCCGNGQQLQWSQEAAPPLNTSVLQARIQVSLHLESKTSKTCTNGPRLAVPLPWSLLLLDHICWKIIEGQRDHGSTCSCVAFFLLSSCSIWPQLVKPCQDVSPCEAHKVLGCENVSPQKKPHNSRVHFRNSYEFIVKLNVENF